MPAAPRQSPRQANQFLSATPHADIRTVVSGGAYGIEGAAPKGVLASAGHTIALPSSGLDRLDPTGTPIC